MSPSALKLSIRAATLDVDIAEAPGLVRRMGLRGIQYDTRSREVDLAELSASGVRELRHLIAREDLTLESLRAQLPADLLMQNGSADRVIWGLDRSMRAAASLGAGALCVDVGRLPTVAAESRPKPLSPLNAGLIIVPDPALVAAPAEPAVDDPAWAGVDELMRELGARADRYGVILAFSSELSSFASVKRLLEGARCPWFGLDLDPVSVLRDAWDMEHVLDALGGALRHVRARDAVKGTGGRTQPAAIGDGSTDWAQLLSILDDGGYAGWITVDPADLPDRARASAAAVGVLASLRRPRQ